MTNEDSCHAENLEVHQACSGYLGRRCQPVHDHDFYSLCRYVSRRLNSDANQEVGSRRPLRLFPCSFASQMTSLEASSRLGDAFDGFEDDRPAAFAAERFPR